MKKVYCKNCVYLCWNIEDSYCEKKENMFDTFLDRKYGDPEEINKNNDCKHFEEINV